MEIIVAVFSRKMITAIFDECSPWMDTEREQGFSLRSIERSTPPCRRRTASARREAHSPPACRAAAFAYPDARSSSPRSEVASAVQLHLIGTLRPARRYSMARAAALASSSGVTSILRAWPMITTSVLQALMQGSPSVVSGLGSSMKPSRLGMTILARLSW